MQKFLGAVGLLFLATPFGVLGFLVGATYIPRHLFGTEALWLALSCLSGAFTLVAVAVGAFFLRRWVAMIPPLPVDLDNYPYQRELILPPHIMPAEPPVHD